MDILCLERALIISLERAWWQWRLCIYMIQVKILLFVKAHLHPSIGFNGWILVKSLGFGKLFCDALYSVVKGCDHYVLWLCYVHPVEPCFPKLGGGLFWGLGWEVSLHGSLFYYVLQVVLELEKKLDMLSWLGNQSILCHIVLWRKRFSLNCNRLVFVKV